MYNNQFIPPYNQQTNLDKINEQISTLEKMKAQLQQPPAINQTFQLAPFNKEFMKYANSIDEVQRDMVMGDTPYFSKDMSVVWVKNIKGEVKTYELSEIIPKDEKDIQIEFLKNEIENLKKEMKKNEQFNTNITSTSKDEKPSNVETISRNTKQSKQPTGNLK